MYGKIFTSIYDGTLHGRWEAIVTFQQMIVLADADGVIDITPPALSARTSIPLDILERGIKVLAEPDPYSRSPDSSGCRIELIEPGRPWGWRIVNYVYYRGLASREDKRQKDRVRIAEKREKTSTSRDVASCRKSSQTVANVAYTEEDTEEDKKKLPLVTFDDWWRIYPKKVKRKNAREIWKRKKLDGVAATLIADIERRLREDDRWRRGFIPDPTTYLNGERWADEIAAPQPKGNGAVPPISDEQGLAAYAAELGLSPKAGESWQQFRSRVCDEASHA